MMGARWFRAVTRRLQRSRFLHGEGPEAVPITLNRHRIFILPTREGVLFAGMMAVILIGSMNYNNSMGFVLTFLLAGLGLVSMLHTYRNMALLTFRAGHCAPVFAGEQAHYTLFIDNPSPVQRCALTLILDDGAPARVDVPAQDAARVVVTRPAPRRGYRPMGRCTVSTRFPTGLFCAWAYIDLAMQCVVYPAPARHHPLPPLHASDNAYGEAYGQGAEDFAGLRQYILGDAPRHIAWKHAARDGAFMTKQFAGAGDVQRWLTWDDATQGDVEARLSVLCSWVLGAHAAGVPYGLRLPDRQLPPAWTPAHRDACLEALALYNVASG